jgi:phosphoribosylaminoimidazolecarboxamide formyltransferase/IMP cyclohydrolase
MSENHKIKRALVSVSDKTGVAEFCKKLSEFGIEIFSTGGTMKLLAESGIPVKSVSELTGFPEIMNGRVKTLHPAVHAGLLADLGKDSHRADLESQGFESIDLLVVNLYPFEKVLSEDNPGHERLVENIDIGGPAMLRAAAKNYKWTAPVVNPEHYSDIVEYLENGMTIPEEFREKLAAEVFSLTSYYDSLISGYLNEHTGNALPLEIKTPAKIEQSLRYGENPQQPAALYGNFGGIFEKLHGKELSYNNIIDIDAAAKLINEFEDTAVAIIKHTNPCGVGLGDNISEAYSKAFETDNVSPFGGIIATNRTVDAESANTMHPLFTEVIIAPEFTDEALEILMKKANRRLIRADYSALKNTYKYDLKAVAGGFLAQKSDSLLVDDEKLKVVTQREPTPEEMRSLMFGWRVCKHVKSNAIVYTSHDRTLGIGAGQMSRVDSSRIAVEKAKLMELSLAGSTVASDAFFPFPDGLIEAAKAGATAVIQPGGSVRDEDVIKAADEHNIAMIFTGMRHFRH